MQALGIDVGGSGIKGAIVDLETGTMVTERHRIPTPEGAEPKDVAKVVGELARHFNWHGPVGAGFPAIIQHGVASSAANVSKKWVGMDAAGLFSKATGGCPVTVVNDADAAGLAEMQFGAGKDVKGVILIITIGTGLGTALFTDGVLVPNTELGHIEVDGEDAESRASDAARKREDLSWKEWAKRFDHYLDALERLFSPDMFILGGGASKKMQKFEDRMSVRAKLVPAKLLNEAGIIGAALATAKQK